MQTSASKCWARRREGVAAAAARIRQDVKKSNLDATTKNKDGKKENGILKKKLNRKKMRRSFFLDLDLPPKSGDRQGGEKITHTDY